MAWLAAAAALIGANIWLSSGLLLPIGPPDQADFIFLHRPLFELIIWFALAAALLEALHIVIVRRANLTTQRYLTPLLLLALPLLAVALLATPLRPLARPWLFLFVDLRWSFYLGVVVLLIIAFPWQASQGAPEGGFATLEGRPKGRQYVLEGRPEGRHYVLILEVALVGALAICALATSPNLRFQSAVLGDEPKYLRFLENWYRGGGIDITNVGPIEDLPPDFRPNLAGNLRLVLSTLPTIAGDLAADAGRALGFRAPRRPGPATKMGGEMFVRGKRGGTYQVHNPGFPLLLLPGYFIDRSLLNWDSRYHPQFPTNLYATNLTVIVIYLLWGVALFRLLLNYTGKSTVSWLLAFVVMTSVPAIAFNYQYYPEAAAGLAVTLSIGYAVFEREPSVGRGVIHGLLAGFLPWLHPRWGVVTMIAGITTSISQRRSRAAVVGFWIGASVPLVAMALYTYHITGSVLPWTLFATIEGPGFDPGRMLRQLPGFWADRWYGIVANAPVYVLAIPGLWFFSRRRPDVAIPVVLTVLLVAALDASHSITGAGTTPLRLIASVLPLLALPLADAVEQYRRSRWFVVTLVVLAGISIQNGFAYSLAFNKSAALLRTPGVSGWNIPLLLPDMATTDFQRITLPMGLWLAAAIALVVWPALRRRVRPVAPAHAVSWTVVSAAVLLAIAVAGSTLGAFTGTTFGSYYQLNEDAVRFRVLERYVRGQSNTAWSATRGAIDPGQLFQNPLDTTLRLFPPATPADVYQPATFTVEARGSRREVAWGTLTADFGDDTSTEQRPVLGSADISHTYRHAGQFPLTVRMALSDGRTLQQTALVRVNGFVGDEQRDVLQTAVGIGRDVLERPASLMVESLSIGDGRLDVQCLLPDSDRSTQYFVWLINHHNGLLRADLQSGNPTARDGPRVTLSIAPRVAPPDGELTGILIAASDGRRDRMVRSEVVSLRWPARNLTVGAPLVVRLSAPARRS